MAEEKLQENEKFKLPEDGRMVLRTENLVKKYGKRTVVSHVSINVKQGEIVGLLGPNGAGKTTSFYMTTGLIVPNEGHIYLNDQDITSYPVYKRAQNGIGYLAQEASVFRKMSVEDNIASVLELTNKPAEYQKEKLESLLNEFRLQKVRKNLGDQLSGGERRRTEIARCLAIDPKFIMLDEPFAGVDPIAVEDIQHIVWRLKDKNIGILITDHNVQETLSRTNADCGAQRARVTVSRPACRLSSPVAETGLAYQNLFCSALYSKPASLRRLTISDLFTCRSSHNASSEG